MPADYGYPSPAVLSFMWPLIPHPYGSILFATYLILLPVLVLLPIWLALTHADAWTHPALVGALLSASALLAWIVWFLVKGDGRGTRHMLAFQLIVLIVLPLNVWAWLST